jgi:hypothetical protein
VALGVLLAPAAAGAAEVTPTPVPSAGAESGRTGLALAGFDEEVARANGYEIVTLPDGSLASVPAAMAEAAETGEYVPTSGVLRAEEEPQEPGDFSTQGWEYGEAYGDCGYSYVAFWAVGNSYAQIQTGFVITDTSAGNVWQVNWNVNIHDNGGSTTQHWEEGDGIDWGQGWTSSLRLLGLTRGYADATVEWFSSYVITNRGWICWSMGPVAVTNVY